MAVEQTLHLSSVTVMPEAEEMPAWACAFDRGLCSIEVCKETGRSTE